MGETQLFSKAFILRLATGLTFVLPLISTKAKIRYMVTLLFLQFNPLFALTTILKS